MLHRIYGKIIISWVARIEFLSLVPDHILMLLPICGWLIIVILLGFSSQGKLQRFNQFYIVDSVISMLFTMSMNVILHEVLLMVILPMLLPLIKECFLLIKVIPLFDWLAPRPKCFKNYVTENPELFQDNPDLAEDFDSPICFACTMAKKLQ